MDHKKPLSSMRKERLLQQITMQAVAKQVGISQMTLGSYETGRSAPTHKAARALYFYYKGKIPLVEIYDPFFEWETGKKLTSTQQDNEP